MALDWRSLFDRVGIQYVVRSSNISAGEIGIKCPWCGASDPSEHMAVDEHGKGYVCRRNRSHRGKSPVKLIAKIKQVPYEQAERIVGQRMVTPQFAGGEGATVLANFKRLLAGEHNTIDAPARMPKFPKEFKPLRRERGMAMIFWNYLREDRGFSHNEIVWLVKRYDLHYAIVGEFAYRLIIPIYDEFGYLVNWTGRTISKTAKPRYRALPEHEAVAPGKMIFDCDQLMTGGSKLIVCEGPLDAFRISVVGYKEGIYGTCLFGTNISPEQSVLLRDLEERFDETYLTLDPDARLRIMGMLTRAGLRIPSLPVPDGIEDPGKMTADQARNWLYF